MRLVALLLLLWALFGCAVVVMMVYGVFDHVAMNAPVMATVLATGTVVFRLHKARSDKSEAAASPL
jgi:hypothetical protein